MVNFNLLLNLASELSGEHPIITAIENLAMDDIEMSDAVIELGIATDVLMEGYHNGWSKED